MCSSRVSWCRYARVTSAFTTAPAVRLRQPATAAGEWAAAVVARSVARFGEPVAEPWDGVPVTAGLDAGAVLSADADGSTAPAEAAAEVRGVPAELVSAVSWQPVSSMIPPASTTAEVRLRPA